MYSCENLCILFDSRSDMFYELVLIFLEHRNKSVIHNYNMDSKQLSSTVASFAAKFCNLLDKKKNVVSSPLSVETLLGLLTLGSTDPAHSELLASLDLPDDDSVRSTFSTLSKNQKSVKGVTLNVASKVYLMDQGYKLNNELELDAVNVFDAGIEKINFSKGAEAAATINKWVKEKTNNRITNVMSPDDLNDLTRLVLVNAIYFKGSWKMQFHPEFTKPRDFYLNSTDRVRVDMMHIEEEFRFRYSEKLGAKLLQLQYEGGGSSMLFVLPDEIEGLDTVLQKLADGYDLMNDVEKLYITETKVFIPKFKIETEIDLNDILPKLGINSIFDKENSGLTKLLDCNEKLYVSKVLQKAFIEVNEEGAEAAAATGMLMDLCACTMKPPEFVADHPFLYVLFGPGRSVYFIGVFRASE